MNKLNNNRKNLEWCTILSCSQLKIAHLKFCRNFKCTSAENTKKYFDLIRIKKPIIKKK
jgi:hypothetical protein